MSRGDFLAIRSIRTRVIGATIGGVRIVCLYAVNGRTVGSAEYATKLRWYEALRAWLRTEYDPALLLLLVGDFNIAPDDRDVHDPLVWQKRIMCSEEERQELTALMEWGLTDLTRLHEPGPGPFTWWDYRQGAFHSGLPAPCPSSLTAPARTSAPARGPVRSNAPGTAASTSVATHLISTFRSVCARYPLDHRPIGHAPVTGRRRPSHRPLPAAEAVSPSRLHRRVLFKKISRRHSGPSSAARPR
ncbi:endonuclease/exonuclease/phosphatase family protein [Nonomuraea muscovyensis]|uniref:endonuclease/exonuclease/phosphatase family protein n=1 Tax=Nonomuraea muscovyensis TaxID=1124761 RepID=UPI00340DD73B